MHGPEHKPSWTVAGKLLPAGARWGQITRESENSESFFFPPGKENLWRSLLTRTQRAFSPHAWDFLFLLLEVVVPEEAEKRVLVCNEPLLRLQNNNNGSTKEA